MGDDSKKPPIDVGSEGTETQKLVFGSRPPEDLEDTRVADADELEVASEIRRDKAYLIVLAGANVGEMYRLDEVETVLGRASNATVRLNDEGISRRHARLLRQAASGRCHGVELPLRHRAPSRADHHVSPSDGLHGTADLRPERGRAVRSRTV